MRTIKFRGKRVKRNGWAYGDLRQLDGKNLVLPTKKDAYNASIDADEVDNSTIGQFTGLLDKNGNEIYEGDILTGDKYPFNCDGVDNYYLVIEEVDSDGFLSLAPISRQSAKSTCKGISDGFERDWDSVKNATIIGNIHDNVELLKD